MAHPVCSFSSRTGEPPTVRRVLVGIFRVVLAWLTVFAVLVALSATRTAMDTRLGADIGGAGLLWVSAGAFGWATFRLWRRSRRSGA